AFLRRVKFRECDVQKFPECFFRSIYYICITAYGVKTIYLSGKYVFFQEPCTGFDLNPDLDQYFSHPMPTDLLILYWVQFSYYFSNVYMVQFLDTVKKDTGMMMIHHIVTLLLIGFSYLARYVKVGCVVYLLHDVSDAILESGKLLIYYNGRENKRHPWGELISTSLFVAFTCSWHMACGIILYSKKKGRINHHSAHFLHIMVFNYLTTKSMNGFMKTFRFYLRIYLFPLHLLHAANWCIYLKRDFMMLKFYLLFNFLLVALFTMHLVWGWFILRMAFRLVIGQSNRLEDIREEEESNGHILKEKKARLNAALLQFHAVFDHQRYHRLIHREGLGNFKPSELLLMMQTLCGELQIDEKLFKKMFVERLPAYVQTVSASGSEDLSVSRLAEMVDTMFDVQRFQSPSVAQLSSSSLPMANEHLVTQIKASLCSSPLIDHPVLTVPVHDLERLMSLGAMRTMVQRPVGVPPSVPLNQHGDTTLQENGGDCLLWSQFLCLRHLDSQTFPREQ
ncbi:unnamed protein product, partial [Schistocephalus solidus]|uniref:TLC domain-containing protein n=1 Tax=Schistocephalus solidus TaxID=70667 RepID=A0A183TGY1_SCHSO